LLPRIPDRWPVKIPQVPAKGGGVSSPETALTTVGYWSILNLNLINRAICREVQVVALFLRRDGSLSG
jgi:hypothetical protein